jgi:acetylornithine deacetylase/succinyl-diaminopimelate desuccinylase-like protein
VEKLVSDRVLLCGEAAGQVIPFTGAGIHTGLVSGRIAAQAAVEALEEAFGHRPLLIREGGSIPLVPMFERILGAPAVLIGFGLPGSNLHGPDEWLNLEVYHRGIGALASMWGRLAG